MKKEFILGISAYYHDSAAALLCDGEIIAAVQEERFSRKKFDASFPKQAIRFCLQEADRKIDSVDKIIFYDKPFLKFDRILETYLAFAPKGFLSFQKSMPVWLKEKLFLKQLLLSELAGLSSETNLKYLKKALSLKLGFSEHHLSHAASAFYPSPFEEATVLVLDGVGEWATVSVWSGKGRELRLLREIHFPHSLGLLYSAFTYYCGFKVNSGEYKLMGLAPYGVPKYADLIRRNLVEIADDGTFRLNLNYFDFCKGLRMTNPRFHKLFGGPPRKPDDKISERHMDIAASIQIIIEEILLKMARSLARELPSKNLCLAGGVALNCVVNGKILRDGCFDRIWVQPAAGDSGGALGAAWVGCHLGLERERSVVLDNNDSMKGAYLGPEFSDCEIEDQLKCLGARYHTLGREELIGQCSNLLSKGKALAWFQGRMEFGPRALGARSILADPRSETMQSTLNLKIKFRESFRPFAPAVLREDLTDWFDLQVDSPYMLFVADVVPHRRLKRSQIPAVTHVDGSARVQTVHRESNPVFHALLSRFKRDTGCPVLVNTSFNVRGEPIVSSPSDAFRCFMGTDLDALAIGSFLLLKEEQTSVLRVRYDDRVEKD